MFRNDADIVCVIADVGLRVTVAGSVVDVRISINIELLLLLL